jgi:hypothetical protein
MKDRMKDKSFSSSFYFLFEYVKEIFYDKNLRIYNRLEERNNSAVNKFTSKSLILMKGKSSRRLDYLSMLFCMLY